MIIKIEKGANVQITDKPIINVNGNLQHNEYHFHPENMSPEVKDADYEEVK